VLLETGRQSVSDPSPLLPALSAASDVAVASASAQIAAAGNGGGAFEGLLLSRSALLTAAVTSTAGAAGAAAQTVLTAAPPALLLALCARACDGAASDDSKDDAVQLRRVTALESHLSAAGLHRAQLPLLGVLLREGRLVLPEAAAAAAGCEPRELAAERAAVRQQRMVRVAECYVAEAGRVGAAGDSLLAAKLLGAAAQWFVTAANR
jgi:hypothetical protein